MNYYIKKQKLGYPLSYGDDLTPKMARQNRKSVYGYSVLTYISWMYILGFGKQTQHSYENQDIPKTEIVRPVQSHHSVDSISRGGDLGKSGPGPRAIADAARNARKTGGGSPFDTKAYAAESPGTNGAVKAKPNKSLTKRITEIFLDAGIILSCTAVQFGEWYLGFTCGFLLVAIRLRM